MPIFRSNKRGYLLTHDEINKLLSTKDFTTFSYKHKPQTLSREDYGEINSFVNTRDYYFNYDDKTAQNLCLELLLYFNYFYCPSVQIISPNSNPFSGFNYRFNKETITLRDILYPDTFRIYEIGQLSRSFYIRSGKTFYQMNRLEITNVNGYLHDFRINTNSRSIQLTNNKILFNHVKYAQISRGWYAWSEKGKFIERIRSKVDRNIVNGINIFCNITE